MTTPCEIMETIVIEYGDKRICIWPVLEMSENIPPDQRESIRRSWPRYEKAMRIFHASSMTHGTLSDAAAEACTVIDTFSAEVARVCLGEPLSRRKRPQRVRGIKDFEILKRVTFHTE